MGLVEANKVDRQAAPLNKLVIGLECGGSDGFSGISANPALGYTSDLVNALGGATILSEFPELNGVEQELINRCENNETAHKFYDLMNSYEAHAIKAGSGFDANPSPGNIKDGLITDAIKSAGAAKKGGTAPIVDVLDYTEPVSKQGLNLLCTPGNDVESTTGLAASGANIIIFTTGLGTPTGNPVAPVIKVSSNTSLYNKMKDIIEAQGRQAVHLEPGSLVFEVAARKEGTVTAIDNYQVARIARLAGAPMDKEAGVDLVKKIGDTVSKGETMYRVHARFPADFQFAKTMVEKNNGYSIGASDEIPEVFAEF